MEWIIALTIIFLAALLKGLTGFGFALLSLPFLMLFFPVKDLVPTITMLSLLSSVQVILLTKEARLDKKEIPLQLWGITGIIGGIVLLKYIPAEILKMIIAILLILVSVAFLEGFRFKIKRPKRARMIAGLTSGFLGGSLSISGPPLALFLTSMDLSTSNFRVTFSWFSTITACVSLAGYYFSGLLTWDNATMGLGLFPAVIVGTLTGQSLTKKVSTQLFYKVCIWVTLVAGVSALVSVVGR